MVALKPNPNNDRQFWADMLFGAVVVGVSILCGLLVGRACGSDLVPVPSNKVDLYRIRYATPLRDALWGTYRVLPRSPIASQSPHRYWRWSADARHHAAIVQVRAGNNGGSGTLVSVENGRGLVITAAHVVSGHSHAAAVWSTGYESAGRVLAADHATDVAAISVKPPAGAVCIPVAREAIDVPAWFEFCGYGGPTDRLRHWWGRMTEADRQNNHSDTNALSGDSGGAVLAHWSDGRIELVGVIEGSRYTQHYTGEDGRDWSLHYPLRSSKTRHVHALLTQCGPWGCQPQYGPPIQRSPQRRGAPTAPTEPIDPIHQAPDPPSPAEPPACELTPDQLATLIDTLAKHERFRGPAGPAGRDGRDGAPGSPAVIDYDRAAVEVIQRLPPIRVESYAPDGHTLIDAESYPYPGPIRLRYGLAQ